MLDGSKSSLNRTSLKMVIKRCDPKNPPPNQNCMNDTELYDYFEHSQMIFMQPITYIDYDDISRPVKTSLR